MGAPDEVDVGGRHQGGAPVQAVELQEAAVARHRSRQEPGLPVVRQRHLQAMAVGVSPPPYALQRHCPRPAGGRGARWYGAATCQQLLIVGSGKYQPASPCVAPPQAATRALSRVEAAHLLYCKARCALVCQRRAVSEETACAFPRILLLPNMQAALVTRGHATCRVRAQPCKAKLQIVRSVCKHRCAGLVSLTKRHPLDRYHKAGRTAAAMLSMNRRPGT